MRLVPAAVAAVEVVWGNAVIVLTSLEGPSSTQVPNAAIKKQIPEKAMGTHVERPAGA